MLTPDELTSIVESMYPHIDELNDWIVKNIVKSIMARLNRGEALSISETNKWQMTVLQATGHHFDDLQAEIQNFTRRTQKEIQQIFEDAGIRSWESDEDFYQLQGFEPRPLITNKRILDILEDSYKRTNGEIRNLTRTTALMSQRNLENVLDRAHMKVITGAQSYSAAYREAINELTGYQAEVLYPSGHKDTVETAVLRCIRTGTAQASGNMALENMIQHDWDLIRVSAHLGARYGDGGENPGNHFWWQGKLCSRTGKDPKYPDFVSTTGYGTGEGLSGWNCRHSFGPGDPDHNPFKDYDEEENRKAYDLSQKQRAAERKIRHQKTKVLGLQEAMNNASSEEERAKLEESYQKEALKLQKYNGEYNKLCEDNGLKKLSERITVQKWNRSEAAKATQAARKVDKGIEKSSENDIIKMSIYFNSSDRLYSYSKRVKNIDGFEDIAVHGDKYGFAINDKDGKLIEEYTPKEFAEILKADPNYHGGAIRLLSCETGSKDATAAQQLSNALNVNVLAPNDTLFIDYKGNMTIGPDEYTNSGKWILFKPKGGEK